MEAASARGSLSQFVLQTEDGHTALPIRSSPPAFGSQSSDMKHSENPAQEGARRPQWQPIIPSPEWPGPWPRQLASWSQKGRHQHRWRSSGYFNQTSSMKWFWGLVSPAEAPSCELSRDSVSPQYCLTENGGFSCLPPRTLANTCVCHVPLSPRLSKDLQ